MPPLVEEDGMWKWVCVPALLAAFLGWLGVGPDARRAGVGDADGWTERSAPVRMEKTGPQFEPDG